MRQQNNERLRRAFAQKANVVGQWIERHLDAVATASMQKGKLEENLGRLTALQREIIGFKVSFDELERYNHDIHEALIFENRHTPYTMEVSLISLEVSTEDAGSSFYFYNISLEKLFYIPKHPY